MSKKLEKILEFGKKTFLSSAKSVALPVVFLISGCGGGGSGGSDGVPAYKQTSYIEFLEKTPINFGDYSDPEEIVISVKAKNTTKVSYAIFDQAGIPYSSAEMKPCGGDTWCASASDLLKSLIGCTNQGEYSVTISLENESSGDKKFVEGSFGYFPK